MKNIAKFRKFMTLLYLSIVFIGLTFYFSDKYFSISRDKFLFYSITTSIFIGITIISSLFNEIIDFKAIAFSKKNIIDMAFLGFIVVNIISTLASRYTNYCLIGYPYGRYNGLANLVSYFILYIIIKTVCANDKPILNLVMVITLCANVFALCQYFGIDVNNMYKGATAASVERLLSPIGHKITYASYLSIVTGLGLGLLIKSNRLLYKIFYIIVLLSCFLGGFASMSDCFILGAGAAFAIILLSGGLKKKDCPWYIVGLSLWGFSFGIMGLITHIMTEKGIFVRLKEDVMGKVSEHYTLLLVCSVILVLISTIIFVWQRVIIAKKQEKPEEPKLKSGKIIYKAPAKDTTGLNESLMSGKVLLVLWIIAGIFVIGILGYLVKLYPFDDHFGNSRGIVWNATIKEFGLSSVFNKLFGYGPETVYHILNPKYGHSFVEHRNFYFDNVHSEPLQYLITCGLLGLGFYITMFASFFIKACKASKENGDIIIYMAAVAGYLAQSTVNIAQSCTTPLFFIVFALGVSHLVRKDCNK